MFCSIVVGGACAGAVVVAGWGPLAGLAIYSVAGSATLVPSALLAAHEPRAKNKSARAKAKRPSGAIA
jgi:hypothetical protein